MPITILELAEYRLQGPAETGQDFEDAGLPIMGGCVGCGASIAAYNAYPSKSGYLACTDCVGDAGWDSVEKANLEIFGQYEDGTLCTERCTRPAEYVMSDGRNLCAPCAQNSGLAITPSVVAGDGTTPCDN